MIRKIVFLGLLGIFCWGNVFCREKDEVPRDPFLSPLRRSRTRAATDDSGGKRPPWLEEHEEYIEPLEVDIQGIAWGPKESHVIIGNRVYTEGDTIKDLNAKIVKIDNDVVSIFYKGNMYEKKIKKKTVTGEGS